MSDRPVTPTEPDYEFTPDQAAPVGVHGQRLSSLDFIRGIAVMGIVVANVMAFGQPMAAYMYPGAFTVPHSPAEDWMWVAQFILIDGKMRGLFTLLFGAGILLFLDKAWANGSGIWLQVKRLFWLGAFGLFHYVYIWRGDILFTYACAGLLALLFVGLERRNMLILGIMGYVGGAVMYAGMYGYMDMAADPARAGNPALSELSDELEDGKQQVLADGQLETAKITEGRYGRWVSHNLSVHVVEHVSSLITSIFESVPLMLIGMAFYRYGVFDGTANSGRLRLWGLIMVTAGTALTIPIALWAKADGLTYYGTLASLGGYAALPRLPVIVGLTFLLSLWGAHAAGWLGRRITAAGRVAFSNYIGTSVFMMLIFHGWAGGLFGKLGRTQLYGVAALACCVMLLWSKPWLARYRYGPLEWSWRCLTYGYWFPLRR